jgi:hypothetical protein
MFFEDKRLLISGLQPSGSFWNGHVGRFQILLELDFDTAFY